MAMRSRSLLLLLCLALALPAPLRAWCCLQAVDVDVTQSDTPPCHMQQSENLGDPSPADDSGGGCQHDTCACRIAAMPQALAAPISPTPNAHPPIIPGAILLLSFAIPPLPPPIG